MRNDDIKRALWNFATDEFDERAYRIEDATFDMDAAEAFFMRDCFWLFIRFMLDMDMDPESAYTLLTKDDETMNALFYDACKAAEFN